MLKRMDYKNINYRKGNVHYQKKEKDTRKKAIREDICTRPKRGQNLIDFTIKKTRQDWKSNNLCQKSTLH